MGQFSVEIWPVAGSVLSETQQSVANVSARFCSMAWLEHHYPSIVKRAKKERAEIHWADETGISNQANSASRHRAEPRLFPARRRVSHSQ